MAGQAMRIIRVVGDGSQVVEVDRMSTDSPMFNDPQEQDVLASSSSSEDALKSLEKLENLARLAENAALKDRDVETPQSFVNAEDVNDDIGVTDDISEEANNTKTDYFSGDRDSSTADVVDALAELPEENIAHGGTDGNGTYFRFLCLKLRKGNVFTPVCQSFCSRGCIPACVGADTPPHRVSQHAMGQTHPSPYGHCSGRYASYWNTFLYV